MPTGDPNEGRKRHHLPPEIVTNVQGSSAGAGSGEFHVYKASRRREYERLRGMDEEVKREKAQDEFEKSRAEREKRDEEKTRKNREKREKMKARKVKKGKGGGGGSGSGSGGGNDGAAFGGKGKTGGNGGTEDAVADRATNGEDDAHDKAGNDENRANGTEAHGQTSIPQTTGLVIHDDD